MNLQMLRTQIDALDATLIALLMQRLSIVKQVGAIKKKENLPIEDPLREKRMLERLTTLAKTQGLKPDFVEELFQLLLAYTKAEMRACID